jgi:DNA-3-methyladenine glycosylase
MPEGDAGCVLFRALEPIAGLAEMASNRDLDFAAEPRLSQLRALTSGPGRLSEALAINRTRDNGKDLTDSRNSDLWLGDDGFRVERVVVTQRIGITKAKEEPLRFLIAGNAFVSGKRGKD